MYNVPFLVTDLGHHNAILGRKWLACLDLWLDVRNRQLIWPTYLPPTPSFVKEITVDLRTLLQTAIDPAHQADANRRDQAFQEEIRLQRIPILRREQATIASNNCSRQGQAAAAVQGITALFTTDQEVAIKITINPEPTVRKP
jgi:hypothetical protein